MSQPSTGWRDDLGSIQDPGFFLRKENLMSLDDCNCEQTSIEPIPEAEVKVDFDVDPPREPVEEGTETDFPVPEK